MPTMRNDFSAVDALPLDGPRRTDAEQAAIDAEAARRARRAVAYLRRHDALDLAAMLGLDGAA